MWDICGGAGGSNEGALCAVCSACGRGGRRMPDDGRGAAIGRRAAVPPSRDVEGVSVCHQHPKTMSRIKN